jgi:opacity protein-like surface antigen
MVDCKILSKIHFMKIIAFFCLLSVSVVSMAQNNKNANSVPLMMHGVGVTFQEFDGLSDRIENFSQYKELNELMATLQLGWLKEHNNVISGMTFTAGTSRNGNKEKNNSILRFYGFSADIGYDVLGSQRIMLYPMAGIGYEKYQAKLLKDNSSVDFNGVLQSATEQNGLRPADFKNSFLTYRLGAGFALKSSKNPSHSIGLQAGYIGSFKDHKWRSSENQELKDAPEDGLRRIYATLTFLCQPNFMRH